MLTTTEDASLRSGLCEALGTISASRFPDWQLRQLKDAILQLYSVATDGATHSAATWALGQWRIPVPDLDRSRDPLPGRDWFVNQHDVTMIKIPAGMFTMGRLIPSYFEKGPPSLPANTTPHGVTLTSDFWVSACEVTHGLYQKFLRDETVDTQDRPNGEQPATSLKSSHVSHPANCVNWFDALLFCNWLSRRESRSPCYRRTGGVQSAEHVGEVWEVWECDFGSDGYRLLTEAEWEYACKAMSETAFSFGGFSERLADFAVFHAQRLDYVETKRPNGWGLFDMHGNAAEWCWDPWVPHSQIHQTDPRGAAVSRYRPIRGGTWYFSESTQLRSTECLLHDMLNYRDANIGFRIAMMEPSPDRLTGVQGDEPPMVRDAEQSVLADPSRPPAPKILGWRDEFRLDEASQSTRQTLSVFGAANPGLVVELLDADAGEVIAQGTAAVDGTWTIQTQTASGAPRHFVAKTRDIDSPASFPSNILSFDSNGTGGLAKDAAYFDRPVIEDWAEDKNDGIADTEGSVTIRGTAVPNARVILWDYARAQKVVETRTSPEGRWQLSTGPLSPGKWHFVARAYTNAGVSSSPSELLSLTVDEDGVPQK
jgi:formylglycine-generating enzyme required for sulfatase activity